MLDFSRHSSAQHEDMDITPLLDVVFILLIFFVIAAAFAVRGMEMNLPPAQSSQALSGRVVELRLEEDATMFCDNVPVERAALRAVLQKTVKGFRERPGQLVLKAHPKAPVGALIFIVDEVRLQGGEKLRIATSTPDTAKARP